MSFNFWATYDLWGCDKWLYLIPGCCYFGKSLEVPRKFNSKGNSTSIPASTSVFCLLFKHACSHSGTRAPESQLLLCYQYLDSDSVIWLYNGPSDTKLKWLNRTGTIAQAAYGRNESHLRIESEALRDMPGVVLFPQLYPTSSPYQFKKVE